MMKLKAKELDCLLAQRAAQVFDGIPLSTPRSQMFTVTPFMLPGCEVHVFADVPELTLPRGIYDIVDIGAEDEFATLPEREYTLERTPEKPRSAPVALLVEAAETRGGTW